MMNCYLFSKTGNVCLFDLRIVKIIEVVEDGDFESSGEQFFDKMGAYETSATGHEDSHSARVDLQLAIAKRQLRRLRR
jgi:hypothetical protein